MRIEMDHMQNLFVFLRVLIIVVAEQLIEICDRSTKSN
jgi:hypothetical protein